MRTVSIVIPVWNHWDDLTRPLLNLLEPIPQVEVIVSDDGSTDATQGIDKYAGARVVHRSANEGFAAACNTGAAEATGDVLVFLNNDTVPKPGWLPPLMDSLAWNAGMAGSRIVCPPGESWRAAEVLGVTGACFATPAALWRQLGGFDTAAGFAHSGEELDYGMRADALGYPIVWVPDSVVEHKVSVSSLDQPAEWRQAHYERAYALLTERYGAKWWEAWRRRVLKWPEMKPALAYPGLYPESAEVAA